MILNKCLRTDMVIVCQLQKFSCRIQLSFPVYFLCVVRPTVLSMGSCTPCLLHCITSEEIMTWKHFKDSFKVANSVPLWCEMMLIKILCLKYSLPYVKIFASLNLLKSTLPGCILLNWLQLYPLLPFLFTPLTICADSAQFKIQACWHTMTSRTALDFKYIKTW